MPAARRSSRNCAQGRVATTAELMSTSTSTCRLRSASSAVHPEIHVPASMSTQPIKVMLATASIYGEAEIFFAAGQVGVVIRIVGNVFGPLFLHKLIFPCVGNLVLLRLAGRLVVIQESIGRVYITIAEFKQLQTKVHILKGYCQILLVEGAGFQKFLARHQQASARNRAAITDQVGKIEVMGHAAR